MEINRMSSEELTYVLAIRGITGLSTVDEMRKTLRNIKKLEKTGTSFIAPEYPYTAEQDKIAIETKIAEIQSLIEDFDGYSDSESRKIGCKLAFVLDRINRVKFTAANQPNKNKLLLEILNLKSDYERKIKLHERSIINQSLGIVDVEMLDASLENSDDSDVEAPAGTSSVLVAESRPVSNHSNTVPVSKWNLKFSGDGKECR